MCRQPHISAKGTTIQTPPLSASSVIAPLVWFFITQYFYFISFNSKSINCTICYLALTRTLHANNRNSVAVLIMMLFLNSCTCSLTVKSLCIKTNTAFSLWMSLVHWLALHWAACSVIPYETLLARMPVDIYFKKKDVLLMTHPFLLE